eukprot:Gb_38204 [translate_table: standard]
MMRIPRVPMKGGDLKKQGGVHVVGREVGKSVPEVLEQLARSYDLEARVSWIRGVKILYEPTNFAWLLALPIGGEERRGDTETEELKSPTYEWNREGGIIGVGSCQKTNRFFQVMKTKASCGCNFSLYLMGFYFDAMDNSLEPIQSIFPSVTRWQEHGVEEQSKKGKKPMFEWQLEGNDSRTTPTEEEEKSEGIEEDSDDVQEIAINVMQPQNIGKVGPLRKATEEVEEVEAWKVLETKGLTIGNKIAEEELITLLDEEEEILVGVDLEAEAKNFLNANIAKEDSLEKLDDVLNNIQEPDIDTLLREEETPFDQREKMFDRVEKDLEEWASYVRRVNLGGYVELAIVEEDSRRGRSLERVHYEELEIEKGNHTEIQALLDHYHFLRVVYKDHNNAEDEVIFTALDMWVKNVALIIGANFPFAYKTFFLQRAGFTSGQFMYNIPMNLMEEFLPWLVSSLSIDDRKDMIKCMHKLVPEEEFLQEVVFTWLKEKRSIGGFEESFVPSNEQVLPTSEESWCVKEVAATTRTSNQGSIVYECCKKMYKRPHFVSHDSVNNSVSELQKFSINEILHWHGAERNFRRGMKNQHSRDFSNLPSFNDHLQFCAEVCIFHSVVEDKVVFPAVVQQHFLDEEFEVLPLAQGHYSIEEQRNLLYQSLRVMPLKLLEHALPWFVAMLRGEEAREILLSLMETSCHDFPLGDLPMKILRRTYEKVFVPLTIGGEFNDRYYSSLEVAFEYFRSGADKISLESDAIYADEEYLKTGMKPDHVTCARVVSAWSTLVSMYANASSTKDACKIFEKLPKRYMVSWTAMIVGCASHGCTKEALQLFEEMERASMKPDRICFLGVLFAWLIFLVVLDCWMRAHGNMELGKHAVECLNALELQEVVTAMLLSSIYASAAKWVDVVRLRKMMKNSGVKKEPRQSWIEVEYMMHAFMGKDRSHP